MLPLLLLSGFGTAAAMLHLSIVLQLCWNWIHWIAAAPIANVLFVVASYFFLQLMLICCLALLVVASCCCCCRCPLLMAQIISFNLTIMVTFWIIIWLFFPAPFVCAFGCHIINYLYIDSLAFLRDFSFEVVASSSSNK